ncbi:diguanylate cyclase domain-containing protein [Nocardioides stalactiti]|uniref:diguanylate cyclase domain-containing protein n=1 Tax=Nocardioides stalactiti TaxID=2755356 RepID=UPI001C826430|nr:diguanylate cyclase [Nocardioides stalactiti]
MIARVLREAAPPLVFAVAYATAIMVGRATRIPGSEISLVWPAAAVSVIWLLFMAERGRIELVTNALLLAGLTYGINLVTGAAEDLSAWFVLVNMTLAVVTVGLLRASRDKVALRDPADLSRLLVAVVVGSVSSAALAWMWFAMQGSGDLMTTFTLFAVRNGVTAFVGCVVWLRLREVIWTVPVMTPSRAAEWIATALVVSSIFVWVFWINHGLEIAFLTLVPAMWIALRYTTNAGTLFAVVAGLGIVAATLDGRGVFIEEEHHVQALLSQAMVGSLTLIVLALALFRDSRAALINELERVHQQLREDIALRRRVETELQRLALHDPLTGLANRTLLLLRAEAAIEHARRTGNRVGLMFIDLDGFKQVNDDFGHYEGDRVLTEVARRLGSIVRGPYDTVARLGGDEFAVLCPDIADTQALRSLSSRIRVRLSTPYRTTTGEPIDHLSASLGVALSSPDSTASALLDHADRLMYTAKRAGRAGASAPLSNGR